MKQIISFILSLVIVIGICTSMPFAKVEASAVDGSELFTVKTSGFEKGKITYTVYLNKDIALMGAIVYAKFDSEVLAIDESNTGAYITTDSYGDECYSINGEYEQGFMVGFDNQYSVAHVNANQSDYKTGSNKAYMTFTFKSIDGECPETFVDFYCYEFCSLSNPNNNIECGSEVVISSLSSIHEHSYSDWIVEKEASCTENGKKYKICATCDKKINEEIVAEGYHSFVDGVCENCESTTGMEYLTIELNDDGKSYSVIDCDESTTGELVILCTVNDLPVTSIGDYAFEDCTNLTSIIIGNSVTSIGESAFEGCTSIESVTIPDTVTSIGNDAFNDTGYYNDISNWENGVLYINNHLIESRDSSSGKYEEYTIKEGTKTIAGAAFYDCDRFVSIEIPNSVISIGDYAFEDCTNLTSIIIGNRVTSIGESTFEGCISLELITIPDSVTSIGARAFSGCTSLISITIPDSVTWIGIAVFWDCDSLTSVTIGNGVTSIDYEAFYDCDSITTITIPDSVTNIDERTFWDCDSLTSITIGNGVTNLGEDAFYGTGYYNDSSNWEKEVLYIGNHLIEARGSLNGEYTIKTGTKTIAASAFDECNRFTSIEIPNSVTSIGWHAFYNCNNLENVYISDIGTWCGIDFDYFNEVDDVLSCSCNPLYYADNLYINGELATDIVIPDGVTVIPEYAFYNIDSIVSVTIPYSVTSIGTCAFYNCDTLKKIYISDIGAWCGINFDYYDEYGDFSYSCNPLYYAEAFFVNGEKASDIVIPEGVTEIPERSFYNVDSISSVTIPDSVTSIGDNAFYCCNSLEYVFYNGTKDEWDTIDIGSKNSELINSKIHYEATDHTISGWIIDVEATCTEIGSKHKECTVCDLVFETETISSKGHSISDWVIDKEATVYSAGEKHKECTQCGLILETETIPQLKCSKTKISKISNVSKGIRITWNKVKGADYYDVYRKTKDGSWECLGYTGTKVGYVDYKNFGVTYFTDKTAKSGTTYYYAVKVRNEAGDTDYSNSLSIKRLSDPKLSSASNTSSGVKVSWKKVTGASGYIVYRKTKNGDWKEIGKTSKLYYTDKKAKSGTSYYYSVCAYSGSSKSYYDTDGLSIRRLVAPKISSATSKSEGILLKWNKITGASGYYVYRKASSGEWKRIATVKGNTKIKYLDESPRKGATYQYRVKAYYSKSTSYNSNTYKIKCKY